MISRYSRPEMARLWEPENRYRAWLLVEILACEANARLGLGQLDRFVRVWRLLRAWCRDARHSLDAGLSLGGGGVASKRLQGKLDWTFIRAGGRFGKFIPAVGAEVQRL